MAKNPVFPLYYNDLDRSTRDWTDEEYGAYVRLLVHQWDKGHLPKDYQRLTRIATSLDTNWGMLKDKFPENGIGLKNVVLEQIRHKLLKHKEKQKNNVEKRYQTSTKVYTKNLPLENEYEKENNVFNTKPKFSDFNGLPEIKTGAVIQLFRISKHTTLTKEEVNGLWDIFKIQNLTGDKFYQSEDAVYSHFINWVKNQSVENKGTNTDVKNTKISLK